MGPLLRQWVLNYDVRGVGVGLVVADKIAEQFSLLVETAPVTLSNTFKILMGL